MCTAEVLVTVVLTSMMWVLWVYRLMLELDTTRRDLAREEDICAKAIEANARSLAKMERIDQIINPPNE